MPSITIRNVPEVVHRRLRIRAAKNGRSMEAELRVVLSLAAGLSSAGRQAKAGGERQPAAAPITLGESEALEKVRGILKSEPAY